MPSEPLVAGSGTVGLPRISDPSAIAIDWRVLCFTAAVSIATGLLFGLLPALRTTRGDLSLALKESGNQSGCGVHHIRLRSLLITAEIAVVLILLVGAGLLIRTSLALRTVNPSFDFHNVLTMQMSVAEARFMKGTGMDQFIRDGVRRVNALPGVEGSALSCCLPLETVWQLPLIVEGRTLDGRSHAYGGWTLF